MSPYFLVGFFFALASSCDLFCAQSHPASPLIVLPFHGSNPQRTVVLDQRRCPCDAPDKSWASLFQEWDRYRIMGQVLIIRKHDDHHTPGVDYYFDPDEAQIPWEKYVARYNVFCDEGRVIFVPTPLFRYAAIPTLPYIFPPDYLPQPAHTVAQVRDMKTFSYPQQLFLCTELPQHELHLPATILLRPLREQIAYLHHLVPSLHGEALRQAQEYLFNLQANLKRQTQLHRVPVIQPDQRTSQVTSHLQPSAPLRSPEEAAVLAQPSVSLQRAPSADLSVASAISSESLSLQPTVQPTPSPSESAESRALESPKQQENKDAAKAFRKEQKKARQQEKQANKLAERQTQEETAALKKQQEAAAQAQREQEEEQKKASQENKAYEIQKRIREREEKYAQLALTVQKAIRQQDGLSEVFQSIQLIKSENPSLYREQLLSLLAVENAPAEIKEAARELLMLKTGRKNELVIRKADERRILLMYLLRVTSSDDKDRKLFLKEAVTLSILPAGLEWHSLQMRLHQGPCDKTCPHEKARQFLQQHEKKLSRTLLRYQILVQALECHQARGRKPALLKELLVQAKQDLSDTDYTTFEAQIQSLLPVQESVPTVPKKMSHTPQQPEEKQTKAIAQTHTTTLTEVKNALEKGDFGSAREQIRNHIVSLVQNIPVASTPFDQVVSFIRHIDTTKRSITPCTHHDIALLLTLQEMFKQIGTSVSLEQLRTCTFFFKRISLPQPDQEASPEAIALNQAHQAYKELKHILNSFFIAISELWNNFSTVPSGKDQRDQQRALVISTILQLMQKVKNRNDAQMLVRSLINFKTEQENLFTILIEETVAWSIYRSPKREELAHWYIFIDMAAMPTLCVSYAYQIFQQNKDFEHKMQHLHELAIQVIKHLESAEPIHHFLTALNLYGEESDPFGFLSLMRAALQLELKKIDKASSKKALWQEAFEKKQEDIGTQESWSDKWPSSCTLL